VTLVIGLGSEWRGDDAAGLHVARRLHEPPAPARIIEREGEPLDLIEEWAGSDRALVVDAVSSGAEPGTIHRLNAADRPVPAALFRGSTHALGLADAVELGRSLGRLPETLLVFGIEGGDFGAGAGLTPAVERAVTVLAAELRELLMWSAENH
jgi:hydrogenase maturation protease